MSDMDNDTPTRTAFYRIIEKHAIGWQAEVELFDLISNAVEAKDATISDLQKQLDTVQADRKSDAEIGRRADEYNADRLAEADHRVSVLDDRLTQLAAVDSAREARYASELSAARAESEKVADVADRVVARLTAGLIDQVCELRAEKDRLEVRVSDLERERTDAEHAVSLAALRERLVGGGPVK